MFTFMYFRPRIKYFQLIIRPYLAPPPSHQFTVYSLRREVILYSVHVHRSILPCYHILRCPLSVFLTRSLHLVTRCSKSFLLFFPCRLSTYTFYFCRPLTHHLPQRPLSSPNLTLPINVLL